MEIKKFNRKSEIEKISRNFASCLVRTNIDNNENYYANPPVNIYKVQGFGTPVKNKGSQLLYKIMEDKIGLVKEALNKAIINFGKYKGKSLAEIIINDPEYAQWLVEFSVAPFYLELKK